MVTQDIEDTSVLKNLAAMLGTANSKKWDLVDLKKKNAWMISTLSALSEDQEAKEAIPSGVGHEMVAVVPVPPTRPHPLVTS